MARETAEDPCNLCRGTTHKLRYDYGDVGIYRCDACGLLSLRPQTSMHRLREIYSGDYFRNERFFETSLEETGNLYGYADYLAERANKQYQLNAIASKLYQRVRDGAPDRRPRLLEIGCGLGFFLDTAYDVGFDVAGVEFNPSAVAFLRGKYRFPVFEGAFPEVAISGGPYDVVCAFDVIEHHSDPSRSCGAIARHLVAGGHLVLVTMDAGSLMSRLIGKRLEDFRRTSEHLYFFDRRTISRLLHEAGFEIESIESIGHTFQVEHLLDRLDIVFPIAFKLLKRLIRPRWLLKANIYVDLGTKICVTARKSPTSEGSSPVLGASPERAWV